MILGFLLILIIFILYPWHCFLLGKALLDLPFAKREKSLPKRFYVLVGLLTSNLVFLGWKSQGGGWASGTFIWLLPFCFLFIKSFRPSWKLRALNLSWNFILYGIFNLIVGVSLFDVSQGIHSYWPSNYADLTYHIGMITSFVWGENFPPEYHLFAGEELSYPLLINFWSASFWWIDAEWLTLKYIFLYQWLFITTLLFGFLRGEKFKLFPWAVLLGGGAYFDLNHSTNDLIDMSLPWIAFLETVWIPQRSAIFGSLCLIATLSPLCKMLLTNRVLPKEILFSAWIIFFMPMVHTHSWIISFGVSVLVLTTLAWKSLANKNSWKILFPAILLCFLSIGFLFLLSDKTSALEITPGWKTGNLDKSWINQLGLAESWKHPLLLLVIFWLGNAWNAILIFVVLVIRSKSFQLVSVGALLILLCGVLAFDLIPSDYLIYFGILAGISFFILLHLLSSKVRLLSLILIFFIFGNIFKLAYWEYDQIKIFIPVYLLLLLSFQILISKNSKLHYLLILLFLPGIYRACLIAYNGSYATPYTQMQLENAKSIREKTSPESIIATFPSHNSTITLTGRKMYMGYPGTLWTHGIKYADREKFQKNITNEECPETVCPSHFYNILGREAVSAELLRESQFKDLGDGLYLLPAKKEKIE